MADIMKINRKLDTTASTNTKTVRNECLTELNYRRASIHMEKQTEAHIKSQKENKISHPPKKNRNTLISKHTHKPCPYKSQTPATATSRAVQGTFLSTSPYDSNQPSLKGPIRQDITPYKALPRYITYCPSVITEASLTCHTPYVKPLEMSYSSCTSKDQISKPSFTATEYKTNPNKGVKFGTEWKHKCKCPREKNAGMCEKARHWLYHANHQKDGVSFPVEQMNSKYFAILHSDSKLDEEVDQQIKRDLTRTFPNQNWFKVGGGMEELYRVLKAYAIYSNSIGYVQGMNFICGTLLFHCSEEVAFWMFVILMEDYDLQDVYMEGLPGLYKHTQLINMLISTTDGMREIYIQLV